MLALTGPSPGGGCGDAERDGHGREEAAPAAAPALPGETIALRAAGGGTSAGRGGGRAARRQPRVFLRDLGPFRLSWAVAGSTRPRSLFPAPPGSAALERPGGSGGRAGSGAPPAGERWKRPWGRSPARLLPSARAPRGVFLCYR